MQATTTKHNQQQKTSKRENSPCSIIKLLDVSLISETLDLTHTMATAFLLLPLC